MDQIYPGPYLQYASCAETVDAALAYVDEIILEEGPFDGVIGFSQGAACAARIILRHQARDPLGPQPFKLAVFLCSSTLFYAQDKAEYLQKMQTVAATTIAIPTVHVLGLSDSYRPFGLDLAKLCDRKTAVVVEHPMGHEIPKEKVVVDKTVKAIEGAVRLTRVGF